MAEVRRLIDAWRCRRLAARLVDYAGGALPAAAHAAVERHVARCARCAGAVAALREMPAALAGVEVERPEEFWLRQREQIMRAIHEAAPDTPRPRSAPAFDLRLALPVAAAVVIAVAGYLSLRPPDLPPRTVASLIDTLGPDDLAALAEVTGLLVLPEDLAPEMQIADADVIDAAFAAGWVEVEVALPSGDDEDLDLNDVEVLKEFTG